MRIFTCSGREAEAFLPALAQLRIQVFREFPYLYEGDLTYEQEYLKTYLSTPDSLLVIAQDEDKIVGVSTAIPLDHQEHNVQAPFLENAYPVEKVFYFGESVLLPAYRGQGIGVAFFQEREKFARQLQRFNWTVFCGVIRSEVHPLRPSNYFPLDEFWKKRGYFPTDMMAKMEWLDWSEPAPSSKSLRFWIKAL
jgi:GNAT superfamily N-acetyltransferase